MNYLIDTMIAYYINGRSVDPNFNLQKFLNSRHQKYISSISIIEIYNKNDFKTFKSIMQSLYDNNIEILLYGMGIDYGHKITINDLLQLDQNKTDKELDYLKNIYKGVLAKNIYSTGILTGSLYSSLMYLKDNNISLKNYQFSFLYFENNYDYIINNICSSIMNYYKAYEIQYFYEIMSYIKMLCIICITSSKYQGVEKNQSTLDKMIDDFQNDKLMQLECNKLLIETCNKRNWKPRYIFQKFKECLKSKSIGLNSLVFLIECLFTQEKFDFNDFADFIIMSIIENTTSFAYITSEHKWQTFIKDMQSICPGAKRSFIEMQKYYNI